MANEHFKGKTSRDPILVGNPRRLDDLTIDWIPGLGGVENLICESRNVWECADFNSCKTVSLSPSLSLSKELAYLVDQSTNIW